MSGYDLDHRHHTQRADCPAHAHQVDCSDDAKDRGDGAHLDHRIGHGGPQRRHIGDHDAGIRRGGHDGAGIARPAGLKADEATEGGLSVQDRPAAVLELTRQPGVTQRQRHEGGSAQQHQPRREAADTRRQHGGQSENARADHPVDREQGGAPEADHARRCGSIAGGKDVHRRRMA